MALQFAIIYILVVGLGILSAYQCGMFNEFVEEVHNIDHWNLDPETDDEDWDSDEEEDDDDYDDDDEESDDGGYASGAVSQQTGNSDKAISSK
ncbi:hypothetical protein FVEG_17224 [Fusarium verticillioides 7600]|uniref:Uncharacterized protein n=1 Tax=Gibberella moniliformis (strain M3125 / FGSC 7600) TaxID=334819 RepID=W7NC33_GIBM7|nr:hypothetical protein FVEG_17224 [Fusarium verticillioides 7600]EWG54017.1 hypothetical protein FVEG_17224 [Fusarium verticillioides 7600]